MQIGYLRRICLFSLLLAISPLVWGQTSSQTVQNLKKHIAFLADDKLEGRRTGTKGEELAMEYITAQFKKAGLKPKGTEYFQQNFIVNDGKKMGEGTLFQIDKNKLEINKHYFVFPFSPDQLIETNVVPPLQEANKPWFFDLKNIIETNQNNPHFEITDYIRNNYKGLKERGATAAIFFNTSALEDKLKFDPKDKSPMSDIPYIYLTKEAIKTYFPNWEVVNADDPGPKMKIVSEISESTRMGHNVIGYIDNKAATTVVLGAHYDHLGYGEDGNSRHTSHEHAIHNGADDNASGTAALIELASLLKKSNAKNNNYLFIAFSGEELGLYGSKYFVENPTIDIKSVNYMINMDMLGRLNDSTRSLTIGGYGTSATWSTVIGKEYVNQKKRGNGHWDLFIKTDSSGTGPSDHTSFYRKDIPVLFYFTGLHSDYHKPTDDADKINYEGTALIIDQILELIGSVNDLGKLSFLKTREAQTSTSARFSVSMGIMPDYTYSGTGVKADGVSEGKPAIKAGLKAGDIILQIGDHPTNSLENYMQALGKFKKGEKAKVKYKRGEEVRETEVEF